MLTNPSPLKLFILAGLLLLMVLTGELLLGFIALVFVRILDTLVDIHRTLEELSDSSLPDA